MTRISKVIRELNIGLETLNNQMMDLGLPVFQINDKISEEDEVFLISYFNSDEIKEIDKLYDKIADYKRKLRKFFMKDAKLPIDMCRLEKMQLFNLINSKERNTPTKPSVNEYSEENFWLLYNWYEKWTHLSEEDKNDIYYNEYFDEEDEKEKGQCRIIENNCIDEESQIMSALANGYGDAFGFD